MEHLTQVQRDIIVQNGPPENPHCFPRDSCGRLCPVNIFSALCIIVKKYVGIGLGGVHLFKDFSAFLVLFLKVLLSENKIHNLQDLKLSSRTVGGNFREELKPTGAILFTSYAIVTGKV